MSRTTIRGAALTAIAFAMSSAQVPLKTLDRDKAHTEYSFAIRPGSKPFSFRVELDQTMTVTGVLVFREGESAPFQTLPMCRGISEQLNANDSERELLEHADLNFDGFEDLELLQYYQPHLGTKVYCIFTWDNQRGQFRRAPEVPQPNPVAHPENKTITTHQDWMGGAYADSVYSWTDGKYVLTESSGRGYGDSKCHFLDHCEKLVRGEMVITLWRPAGCVEGEVDPPPTCPAGTKPDPNAPKPAK